MTERARGHQVLASADSDVFASLRKRPSSREERYALGRELRHRVPRSALGDWAAPEDRADPVRLVQQSHRGRVPALVPVRVARMVGSPVRLPARDGGGDGRGRGPAARHRDPAGDLRRRPPRQLRLLRLARGRAGDRPQRLRRGPPRRLGVGPAPAGGQHLGGRPRERLHRGAVPELGAGLRRRLPRGGPLPRRAAAADAQLQPPRRRPAARDRDREDAARRDRAGGQAGPAAHQRPRAAAVHRRARGPSPDRRGAAADHPAGGARGRGRRAGPRPTTC